MTVTQYSRAYDSPLYLQPDPIGFTTSAGSGAKSAKYVSFTSRQLRSVTALPSTAGTSSDVVQFVVITTLAGSLTNTAGSQVGSSYSGTSTLTVLNLATYGSGSVVPQSVGLSGGVFNIQIVTSAGGTSTSTATGALLPNGVNGGLTVGSLDQFYFLNGTDATIVFSGEVEATFTPGTNFTY